MPAPRSRWFARIGLVAPALAVAIAGVPLARAQSTTPREALRETMEPLIDILSRAPSGPSRALALHATLTESSAQPPELIGTHLALYLQPPENRAFFQFLSLGHVVTVCRQGQNVWMAPADRLAPLLAEVEAKPPTKADREPIGPMRLKVPTTLFWLLYRLVPVKDAGGAELGGVTCRRVDVRPPDSEDKNGYLRLWLRADSHALARLEWHGTHSHSILTVDDVRYAPTLPPEVFDPSTVPPETRLPVPADRFRPLMALIGKQEEARRKKGES